MENENQTACVEKLSQDRLDAILGLAHSGSSPDSISFALKIDIERVQQVIANDPMHMTRVVQSILERSMEFRCC
jgi:hypothetical protein